MFAINHAATALLLKRRYQTVSMLWLLISVQLVELAWVALNLVGVESTRTEAVVHSVKDIHLAHMPFSHSVFSTLLLSGAAYLILGRLARRPVLGTAVALGIASHLALDLVTHGADIAILPGTGLPRIGLGLYGAVPLAAFFLETSWGIYCWYRFGGGRGLLAVIIGFNVADITLFVPGLHGPERLLAGHPTILVLVIAVQIVVTLFLVGRFAFPIAPARPGAFPGRHGRSIGAEAETAQG